jgi:hypothetical protein
MKSIIESQRDSIFQPKTGRRGDVLGLTTAVQVKEQAFVLAATA